MSITNLYKTPRKVIVYTWIAKTSRGKARVKSVVSLRLLDCTSKMYWQLAELTEQGTDQE